MNWYARFAIPGLAAVALEGVVPEVDADDVFSRNFLLMLLWANFLG